MHNFKYLLNTYFTIENPYTTILSLTMGIVHSKLNAKPTLKMPPPSPHMHTFFAQVQSITWSLKGTGSNKYMGTFFQNCKRLFPNVYTNFTLDDHIYNYIYTTYSSDIFFMQAESFWIKLLKPFS